MKKTRESLFEELKQGLQQGIAYAKGELNLKVVDLPDDPPEIDAATLAALRNAAGMSQGVFAGMLNVSTKTLQSWEQGVRRPADASRRLIQMFTERPDIFCEVVGLPVVSLPGVSIEGAKGKRRIVVRNSAGKCSR